MLHFGAFDFRGREKSAAFCSILEHAMLGPLRNVAFRLSKNRPHPRVGTAEVKLKLKIKIPLHPPAA